MTATTHKSLKQWGISESGSRLKPCRNLGNTAGGKRHKKGWKRLKNRDLGRKHRHKAWGFGCSISKNPMGLGGVMAFWDACKHLRGVGGFDGLGLGAWGLGLGGFLDPLGRTAWGLSPFLFWGVVVLGARPDGRKGRKNFWGVAKIGVCPIGQEEKKRREGWKKWALGVNPQRRKSFFIIDKR